MVLAACLASFDAVGSTQYNVYQVPMISGRGLQFTGGTLDKLESIPGFKVVCTFSALKEALEKAGCFIAGATVSLAPADKQLYQIRDVTGPVLDLFSHNEWSPRVKRDKYDTISLILQLTERHLFKEKDEILGLYNISNGELAEDSVVLSLLKIYNLHKAALAHRPLRGFIPEESLHVPDRPQILFTLSGGHSRWQARLLASYSR
uniref:Glycosyl transferase family 3 domain-containing protein n=1 Tax=Timema cristinae TaxID=61476 RepID=A0A7R9CSA0_TIMCR|nr:unnamed protein product [Timema cristinae]